MNKSRVIVYKDIRLGWMNVNLGDTLVRGSSHI